LAPKKFFGSPEIFGLAMPLGREPVTQQKILPRLAGGTFLG